MKIVAPENCVATPGKRFGRWTVLGSEFLLPTGREQRQGNRAPSIRRRPHVVCQCDCGNVSVVYSRNLAGCGGRSASCGCLQAEQVGNRFRSHGHATTRLYATWRNMMRRCSDPRDKAYPNYGGRGIHVCKAWTEFELFRQWALASGYTDELEIDRNRNNEGYSPDNCRWVTPFEQNNNKRNSARVTAFGETKTIAEWSKDGRCGVTYNQLYHRLRGGMHPDAAIVSPPLNQRSRSCV